MVRTNYYKNRPMAPVLRRKGWRYWRSTKGFVTPRSILNGRIRVAFRGTQAYVQCCTCGKKADIPPKLPERTGGLPLELSPACRTHEKIPSQVLAIRAHYWSQHHKCHELEPLR